VQILVQRRGSKHFRALRTVRTDALGYWSLSTTRATAWRVRWQGPGGARYEGPPIAPYKAP
jgi:hypothetical protein